MLVSGCRFHDWAWLGQKLILIECGADISPAEARARRSPLMEHFKQTVVFVYAALEAHQRSQLVRSGVPFIVPGLQWFIPPFAVFTERFQRIASAKALSGAAQAAVLFHILRSPAEGALLRQWAGWLGYSAMTLTKVRDELVGAGLCRREPGAKPRGLRFLHRKRALWDTARPYLRSPVKKSSWVKLAAPSPLLIPAGLTALEKTTLVGDEPLPTWACSEPVWRRLLGAGQVRDARRPEDADARVERWRYEPGLLGGNGAVDPLSLHLSFADAADERVRLAADSLLERVPW
ncbi:MAG TPA: hypothetical protein DD417_16435 [Elusimicrobia bacterium]|nr:hypothetical protein [Elusimicrobiota bacterium]